MWSSLTGMSAFWTSLVEAAVTRYQTPFYLFSWQPVAEALRQLGTTVGQKPLRHWLSFKTQPVGPLLRRWKSEGRPVEVVSAFELAAALAEGYEPSSILVNGPAKHWWLDGFKAVGLNVNFDSEAEAVALAPQSLLDGWNVGIRLQVSEQRDVDDPNFGDQFGVSSVELPRILDHLSASVS